jgi:hypothetical protein
MEQKRVPVAELKEVIQQAVSYRQWLQKSGL